MSYSSSIVGAAVFDLSGLPKEYFTSAETKDVNWVQTIFQALGLQSLLMSSLKLEGFHHAIVHEAAYRAVVVRQKNRYIALLLDPAKLETTSDTFINWAQEFEPGCLKAIPQFNAV